MGHHYLMNGLYNSGFTGAFSKPSACSALFAILFKYPSLISFLRYSNALEHLLSTLCRFNKLNLLISTTKVIDSTIVHTTLKEVSIPASERSGGAIANFISVVISLMVKTTCIAFLLKGSFLC